MILKYLGIVALFFLISCKPEEEKYATNNSRLRFDLNTIIFDTVFTDQVSITRRLKVINTNENAITIASIRLGGMANSNYSLIINGLVANQATDVFLRGKDSILILATVKLNKKNTTLPFLVKDSIVFASGNSEQKVYLTAWGRNAEYYRGDTIRSNTEWDSTNVRFIYKSIYVAQGATLTISKGTRVHATKGAGIIVAGSLKVVGDTGKSEKVTFYGSRSDGNWKTIPGQWLGLRFLNGSTNNIINWAEINNAETAILIGEKEKQSQIALKLTNTIIRNMSGSGVIAHGSNLTSWNCLITNCAEYGMAVFGGGEHRHYNNTIANYGFVFTRNFPSVFISDGTISIVSYPISVEFVNNIVWGDKVNEISLVKSKDANWTSSIINFNILRTDNNTLAVDNNMVYNFKNTDKNYFKLINQISFRNERNTDFTIDSSSIATGKGKKLDLFTNDLNAKHRGEKFDIGAYQH